MINNKTCLAIIPARGGIKPNFIVGYFSKLDSTEVGYNCIYSIESKVLAVYKDEDSHGYRDNC